MEQLNQEMTIKYLSDISEILQWVLEELSNHLIIEHEIEDVEKKLLEKHEEDYGNKLKTIKIVTEIITVLNGGRPKLTYDLSTYHNYYWLKNYLGLYKSQWDNFMKILVNEYGLRGTGLEQFVVDKQDI